MIMALTAILMLREGESGRRNVAGETPARVRARRRRGAERPRGRVLGEE